MLHSRRMLREGCNDLSSSSRFSLKQQMRPLKHGHGHLRFDPSHFVETRGANEMILLRLDVQDGHSNPAQFLADIAFEHGPEASGQHLRPHGGDRRPHRCPQRGGCIRPNQPEFDCKIGQRNTEHERREQQAEEAPPASHRACRESGTENQPRKIFWIRCRVLDRKRRRKGFSQEHERPGDRTGRLHEVFQLGVGKALFGWVPHRLCLELPSKRSNELREQFSGPV